MQRVRKQIEVPEENGRKRGVTIAVLDSGIGPHPDLEGKVHCFHDFVGNKSFAYDDNGHGTHVCGIICGSGEMSQKRFCGIAPASGLVVGKVLDARGDGCTESMQEALQWVYNLREEYHIRILNISVGIGNLSSTEKSKKLQDQIESLWDCGIVVVCAAGNKGPGNGSISSLGGMGKVISVGCHDGAYCRNNPGRCETYSGRGYALSNIRKPDIVAPGTDIISCNADFKGRYDRNHQPYVAKSGTSMATPIVTGAVALALQKFPDMTNEELKQKITMTATDLHEPWNKQGWGMVNVRRLLM